jgi:putative transposase
MARIARVVAPGLPHHITPRGNRRQATFVCAEDYQTYLELMRAWGGCWKGEVWAYGLMPNHVHRLAVPSSEAGWRRAHGEAHRRHTRRVSVREGWRGHRWQGRCASFLRDERSLLAAVRSLEQHPVRARLAETPGAYRWSRAAAPGAGEDAGRITVAPRLAVVDQWRDFLATSAPADEGKVLRRHDRSGRPSGREPFVAALEGTLGRTLRRGRPGPKRGRAT